PLFQSAPDGADGARPYSGHSDYSGLSLEVFGLSRPAGVTGATARAARSAGTEGVSELYGYGDRPPPTGGHAVSGGSVGDGKQEHLVGHSSGVAKCRRGQRRVLVRAENTLADLHYIILAWS